MSTIIRDEKMKQNSFLSRDRLLKWFKQSLSALEYLHFRVTLNGVHKIIVHYDIKPE